MKTNEARKPVPRRARRLGRDIWVLVARKALIAGGVENIKIDQLARTLDAERGSFYHHFKNRSALLDELLAEWAGQSVSAYEKALKNGKHNGVVELAYINDMWLKEKAFNVQYDLAIRDWGRRSNTVRKVVKGVDRKRIKILETIFLDLGYEGDNALVRAEVAYFHQIGYFSVNLGKSREVRKRLAPIFFEVLVGK